MSGFIEQTGKISANTIFDILFLVAVKVLVPYKSMKITLINKAECDTDQRNFCMHSKRVTIQNHCAQSI